MTRRARYVLAATATLLLFGASFPGEKLLSAALRPGPQSSSGPQARMAPDQENNATAWTNLLNDARQTFRPSMPNLAAVEVQLVLANPGESDDELTLTLFDSRGQSLATALKTVPAADCDRVMFVFPDGGVKVSPGEVYSLQLRGGPTFGWKYVLGGYEKGEALFNGEPLLPNARSSFLFRTFGVPEGDGAQGTAQPVRPLDRADAGQPMTVKVGERFQITLNTIGPGRYDLPLISSAAVRFDRVESPKLQNPGGPTQIFVFLAVAEGKARIRIPHSPPTGPYTARVRVTKD